MNIKYDVVTMPYNLDGDPLELEQKQEWITPEELRDRVMSPLYKGYSRDIESISGGQILITTRDERGEVYERVLVLAAYGRRP